MVPIQTWVSNEVFPHPPVIHLYVLYVCVCACPACHVPARATSVHLCAMSLLHHFLSVVLPAALLPLSLFTKPHLLLLLLVAQPTNRTLQSPSFPVANTSLTSLLCYSAVCPDTKTTTYCKANNDNLFTPLHTHTHSSKTLARLRQSERDESVCKYFLISSACRIRNMHECVNNCSDIG